MKRHGAVFNHGPDSFNLSDGKAFIPNLGAELDVSDVVKQCGIAIAGAAMTANITVAPMAAAIMAITNRPSAA